MISALPSCFTEYFPSLGHKSCWYEWSDIFLSKGGSKDNTSHFHEHSEIHNIRSSPESLDTLIKLQTIQAWNDRNQISKQPDCKQKNSKRY